MAEEKSRNVNEAGYVAPYGLTVDICIFTIAKTELGEKSGVKRLPKFELKVLLIKRDQEPFKGEWALPGGYVRLGENETLMAAAIRELGEESNLTGIHLEQLKAYYEDDRDPRGYTPTVAFIAIVREEMLSRLKYGGDASDARLFYVEKAEKMSLSFDHHVIFHDAIRYVQNQILTTTLAKEFLPEEFTISDLYQVITAVIPDFERQRPISNFSRDILKKELLVPALDIHGTQKVSNHYSNKPAKLYKFCEGMIQMLSIYGSIHLETP